MLCFCSMQLFTSVSSKKSMTVALLRGEYMQVEVRVFSGLEKFLDQKRFGEPFSVEVQDNWDLRSLLDHLSIPKEQVFTKLVNGKHQELDYKLNDGDRVSLFPPVGGG